MKSTKLENLEKKFNIANSLVSELSGVVDEIGSNELISYNNEDDIEIVEDLEKDEYIFKLEDLKKDFNIIKNNIHALIRTGQRILGTVSVIDISDLKASQLEAINNLIKTIGENSKILIEIYKQITEIEKSRIEKRNKIENPVNYGNITNNNIIFSGSTSQLLEIIKKENQ